MGIANATVLRAQATSLPVKALVLGALANMSYTWVFFFYLADVLTRLAPIVLSLIAVIITNGLAIGRLEGWKRGDALYHAFINATTVGYGDFRPTLGTSKILSVLNAFLGLLFTGIFVGAGVYAVEKTFDVFSQMPNTH
ncbi:MAG: potassium channel family protein [Tateyamaria sp.]|uniref:potassium channel family protein n=1 Tax=Tateyamaria sp. TaxID=1929288 RepID=UPI0032A07292